MINRQIPAEGILRNANFDNYKSYYIPCECGQEHDSHLIAIDANEFDEVTVFIYHTVYANIFEKKRWKLIWQLLTTGRIELQTETVLSKQTAINYAETLKTAVEETTRRK